MAPGEGASEGGGRARAAPVQGSGVGGLLWGRAVPGRSDNLGLLGEEAPETLELRWQLLEGQEGVNYPGLRWRPE